MENKRFPFHDYLNHIFFYDFKAVRKKNYPILAELSGNFDKFKLHDISKSVWPEVEKYIKEKAAFKAS